MSAPVGHGEDPSALALRWALFMLSGDAPAGAFGFELLSAGPGAAELAMTVPPSALNVFGTCHGGVLFTLAHTAIYDCAVINATSGKVVAEFRGHSRTISDRMPADQG